MAYPLGRYYSIKTDRTHYIGRCVAILFKRYRLQLKIARVIRGTRRPGSYMTVEEVQCSPVPFDDPLLLHEHKEPTP